MNFKNNVLLFLLIFGINISQAQITPYEPIVFTDITPVWQHVSMDSTLIDSTHDGMQHISFINDSPFPYLINDNNLYIVNNTNVIDYDEVEGGLIEKLDIRTGELKWMNYYDFRNNEKREYAECIYINDNGNLNVVTDRRINKSKGYGLSIWGDTSLLCIREYDIGTGNLLQQNFPDSTDYQSKKIRFSNMNRTILYPLKDNRFMYIERNLNTNYIRDILDENGYLLDETKIDSIKFEKYFDSSTFFRPFKYQMVKVNEDTLVALLYLLKHNHGKIVYDGYDRQTKLTLYDNDLNKLNVFHIDSLLPKKVDGLLVEADKNFIYIRSWKKAYLTYDTITFSVFNYEGELTYQISNLVNGELLHLNLIYLEREKQFLAVNLSRDKNRMRFYITNGEGTLDLIREINFADNYRTFTTKFGRQLKNGDILLHGLNRLDTVNYADKRRWFTWMRLRAEDIGILGETAVSDDAMRPKLLIYPNPPSDKLNIEFPESFNGHIEIVDELGRMIAKHKITNEIIKTLDISKLQSGVYFVRAISDNKIYQAESFVKE